MAKRAMSLRGKRVKNPQQQQQQQRRQRQQQQQQQQQRLTQNVPWQNTMTWEASGVSKI